MNKQKWSAGYRNDTFYVIFLRVGQMQKDDSLSDIRVEVDEYSNNKFISVPVILVTRIRRKTSILRLWENFLSLWKIVENYF